MALQDKLGDIGAGLFGGLLGGAFWTIMILVIIGALGGAAYYFLVHKKKFNIIVQVISDRASDPKIKFDKAAILYDRKSKTKYFKLFDLKVELAAPPFKILDSTNWGDYVSIHRTSEDQFVFLTKPKIDKKFIIKADGKAYLIERTKQRQIESDHYFILKRKEENKRLIDPDSLLMKFLEHLPALISGFFMLIILYIFVSKLPGILDSLAALAESLKGSQAAVVSVGG